MAPVGQCSSGHLAPRTTSQTSSIRVLLRRCSFLSTNLSVASTIDLQTSDLAAVWVCHRCYVTYRRLDMVTEATKPRSTVAEASAQMCSDPEGATSPPSCNRLVRLSSQVTACRGCVVQSEHPSLPTREGHPWQSERSNFNPPPLQGHPQQS